MSERRQRRQRRKRQAVAETRRRQQTVDAVTATFIDPPDVPMDAINVATYRFMGRSPLLVDNIFQADPLFRTRKSRI